MGIYLTSQKLTHYFQDHSITVVSEAPLAEIMNNRYSTGRIAKWSLDLLPCDLHYQSKKVIKSQALVDFLAEWIEVQNPPQSTSEHWTMFFDGSKMLNGAGAGVVLVSSRKYEMRYVLQIHFPATNNESEYEALLYGLRMAISLGIRRLMIFGDSDLVINQVMKEWDIRSPAMTTYCVAIRKLEKKFDGLELHHIPRAQNQAAYDLAKLGSTRGQIPPGIYLEHLHAPTVREDPYSEADPSMLPDENIPDKEDIPAVVDLVFDIEVIPPEWTLTILRYLQNQKLPEDELEAKQVVRKAKSYSVINNKLYRN